MGPPIASRLGTRDDGQLAKFIHEGSPAKGMPPMPITDRDMPDLLTFLRTLQRDAAADAAFVHRLQARTGCRGARRRDCGQGLRRSAAAYRRPSPAPPQEGWRNLSRGDVVRGLAHLQRRPSGKPLYLDDANRQGQRRPVGVSWMFTLGAGQLQVTPVVVGGIDVRRRTERVLRASMPAAAARSGTTSVRRLPACRPAEAPIGASPSPVTRCSWKPTTRTPSR